MPFTFYSSSSTPVAQFISPDINVNNIAPLLPTSSPSSFVLTNYLFVNFVKGNNTVATSH